MKHHNNNRWLYQGFVSMGLLMAWAILLGHNPLPANAQNQNIVLIDHTTPNTTPIFPDRKNPLPSRTGPLDNQAVKPTSGSADFNQENSRQASLAVNLKLYNLARSGNISELADLIKEYEAKGLSKESKELYYLARFVNDLLAKKARGETLWRSEDWMKPPEYYHGLDTPALAEECFAGTKPSVFFAEMGTRFDDPLRAYFRLVVFHNGFAELFEREDLWKGLVHTIEFLSAQITSQIEWKNILSPSMNLGMMGNLFKIGIIQDKIKGHELDFLTAYYHALQSYQKRLDNHVAKGITTTEGLGFFGEPTWMSNVALTLAKQVDPVQFNRIAPEIMSIRHSREQKPEELKSYLDLVVDRLSGFIH